MCRYCSIYTRQMVCARIRPGPLPKHSYLRMKIKSRLRGLENPRKSDQRELSRLLNQPLILQTGGVSSLLDSSTSRQT